MQIKFPLPPVGEGNGDLHLVSFKDLRPSFSWNPLNWWRHLGSKVGVKQNNRECDLSLT